MRAAFCWAAFAAAIFASIGARAGVIPGDYPIPAPWPSASPGSVAWVRPLRSGAALPHAARNELVLYHTRDARGRDVPVSGTIAIPRGTPPPGGWPIISWAHGTTGNAPQCAPSRFKSPDGEQRFLDRWVARGFAVVQTDYEGEATPGIHPYFVGVAGAHDVIDMVRAARAVEASLGTRWIAMGHSEGGAVTLFAAANAASWAPELHLVGAVAYAPASHITSFLLDMLEQSQPTSATPLLAMMVLGIGSSDPSIHLNRLLSPRARAIVPLLESRCAGTLMQSGPWRALPPDMMFRSGAHLMPLVLDFAHNEPGTVRITVPLRIEQGTDDEMVPYATTLRLVKALETHGTHPHLDTVRNATHSTVIDRTFERVYRWVRARLASSS